MSSKITDEQYALNSNIMAHMGVEFKGRKYAGVSVSTRTKNGRYRKTVFFGGSRTSFAQDLMDAKCFVFVNGYRGMWSSSVDHYVMDTKPWGWCENGFMGEYVVLAKNAELKWHEFTKKASGTRGREKLWIQNGGKSCIKQNRDKPGWWWLFHPEANDACEFQARDLAEAKGLATDVKFRTTMEV